MSEFRGAIKELANCLLRFRGIMVICLEVKKCAYKFH